jgi:asparagine synthetase B (glutamine-hydrolysing)
MQDIKTSIIPIQPTFAKIKAPHKLDYEAICVFVATGFFLDQDTYWKDEKVLRPGHITTIDAEGYIVKSEPWFKWYYAPRDINLRQAVSEFTILFETIVKEQSQDRKVILPLSGGLDSRSQAVALHNIEADVVAYSYSYENGYDEAGISEKIAKCLNMPFQKFTIPKGYLWNEIENLAKINGCYSEFTHPRQMAVANDIGQFGDVFSLGHWGDVLFDSDVLEVESDDEVTTMLRKKIIKKGGLELAENLWQHWGLEGDFQAYLNRRLLRLWNSIEISNISAKLRAFKSLYWAPRWTSVNLAVFENEKPIQLPYYDDSMCEFICTIPEVFLADRKIQIEYIKQQNPKIAKIVWQDVRPFNLYTAHLHKFPYNFPYRVISKINRVIKKIVKKPHVQRNWELQFLGNNNEIELERYLFNSDFQEFIPKTITEKFYQYFKNKDQVYYSHAVSMLLTLALRKKIIDDEREN